MQKLELHDTQRRKRDIAYACFIPWGLATLIESLSLDVADERAAARMFLILFPLAIVGVFTTPVGLYYSVVFRRDAGLLLLSLVTLFMMLVVVSEKKLEHLYDASELTHAIVFVLTEASWFFFRRRRKPVERAPV